MRAAAARWICPPDSLTPARADRVSRPASSAGDVVLHDRARSQRPDRPFVGRAQQHVVAQRVAEQARHLSRVGAARRHQERCRVVDRRAVPADLARVARQQAEQHPQQRGLAGADASGDHHPAAARDIEVDRRTRRVRKRGDSSGRAPSSAPAASSLRARLLYHRNRTQRMQVVRDQLALVAAVQQLGHAVERNADLPVARQHAPDQPR